MTTTTATTNDITRKIYNCIILIEKFYIEHYPILVQKFKDDISEEEYNEEPEKDDDGNSITYNEYLHSNLTEYIEWGRVGMMMEMCGDDIMESIIKVVWKMKRNMNITDATEYITNDIKIDTSILPDEKLLELITLHCSTEHEFERFITKKLSKIEFNDKYKQLINNVLCNTYL